MGESDHSITVTAKVRLYPDEAQKIALTETFKAYRMGCNRVSKYVNESKSLVRADIHKAMYYSLRSTLKAQMSCSVIKTVIARYKSAKSNGHDWSLVNFKRPEYDLVWNRDYSLVKGFFSINSLSGRLIMTYNTSAMEQYFNGAWSFGSAKLIQRKGKFYLHIPVTKKLPPCNESAISVVVGIDLGLNFIATATDNQGKTTFYDGRWIKDKRAQYASVRKSLQRSKTPSARRRLMAIGQREFRFMTQVNHQVSKALVGAYGANTLFVVEDLSGVRSVTEIVRKKDRYIQVSWAFYQLRKMIEYKARLSGSVTLAVDPRYTSQRCPICGHIEAINRNKKKHTFECKVCHYRSNDDRVASMNLRDMGIKYLAEVTV
jgi:IS605 OrfB family transposase